MQLISDIETDGFLENVTVCHGIVIKDAVTGQSTGYADQPNHRPISQALERLEKGEELIFHNGIKYDIPVLQKLYPRFKPKGKVTDTLVMSRLIWTNLINDDDEPIKKGRLPGNLRGLHSLEAWGYRLGSMKDEYAGDPAIEDEEERKARKWERWNPTMHAYMLQDAEVTASLLAHIRAQEYSAQAIELEHEFATIIAAMERRGIRLDVKKAQVLYQQLVKERLGMGRELAEAFPPKVIRETFIPKRPNRKLGYTGTWLTITDPDTGETEKLFKGDPFVKERTVAFNPSSRQMVADRLTALGWQPAQFTPSGQPKIDEKILSKLPYPAAKVLARHFLIEKRIGQIAEGDQAWLRLERNGKIHHSVNPNGTPTGRCTHSRPNVAQTPKVGSAFGSECRDLYTTTVLDWWMVGIDLSGIELRCLAHYMARYDDGAYAKAVVEGREADGTDVHSVNAKALGLDPKGIYIVEGKSTTGRNLAKTFIYAFLYGAGDEKLGSIIGVTEDDVKLFRQTRAAEWTRVRDRFVKKGRDGNDVYGIARQIKGGIIRTRFMKDLPALKKLIDVVKDKAKKQGFLVSLDGRRIHVRSPHSALNSLLQTAGAVIAKQATVFACRDISDLGYIWGRDWALLLHVHDELQIETREELADELGDLVVRAMQQCGPYFNLRVPIDGGSKKGRTWRDTH